MSHIEIHQGLRRLEFSSEARHPHEESGEALVEFVRGTPLLREDTVKVSLGRRGPTLRELSGRPHLIRTDVLADGSKEYHYQIRGAIEVHGGE